MSAVFVVTAAYAEQPAGERAEIERLQRLYDRVEAGDANGTMSQIIVMPEAGDEATHSQYGTSAPDSTPQTRTAAFMRNVIEQKYGARIPQSYIESPVLEDHPLSTPDTLGPVSVSAAIRGLANINTFFACFAAMPPRNDNVKEEVLAFIGLREYTGSNGVVYDGSTVDNPFEYHFDIPFSAEAWRSFKTHYSAAQCLIDQNSPALRGQRPDEKTGNAIRNAATGFAAVMAARDGHPEILPFMADFLAATVHNPGSYSNSYTYAQLVEEGAGMLAGPIMEQGSGGYQMSHPLPLLDQLNSLWAGNGLQSMPVEELYPFIFELALQSAFDEKQNWTFAGISMPHYEPAEADMDKDLRATILERAKLGAERLNVCVTYSRRWQEMAATEGKDFWAERRQDIWTPRVCP